MALLEGRGDADALRFASATAALKCLRPDGAAWVTDSGQNAIVRVDPKTLSLKELERLTRRYVAEIVDAVGTPIGNATKSEQMRAAGYQTGMSGKWHLGSKSPQRPFDRGLAPGDERLDVLAVRNVFVVLNVMAVSPESPSRTPFPPSSEET